MTLRALLLTSLMLLSPGPGRAAPATGAEQDRHFYFGGGLGIEGYAKAEHNSYSSSRMAFIGWDNRETGEAARPGRSFLHLRGTHSYEKSSEQSDSQRYRESWSAGATLLHPFRALGQGSGPWLVAWLADLEYEENSQQLEEFEYMAALGPALARRFGRDILVDTVAGLSLACNEEEKDDDWPRENFDIGRDELNRRGCGHYLQWKNRITLPTATEFGLSLDYYEGRLSYGNQYYRRERLSLYMQVPLARRHHHLRLAATVIDRDAEIEFTGFDDRLKQAAVEYIYRF